MDYFPPWLEHVEAYVPGEHLDGSSRPSKSRSMVKLASNENPLGASAKAREAAMAADFSFYPDAMTSRLREALARRHAVSVDKVFVGNGTSQIVYQLAHAIADRWHNAVYAQYAFMGFPLAIRGAGLHPVEVPTGPGYAQDLDAMARACNERTRLLFIANPNNPTGVYSSPEAILRLLADVPPHVLVVLDEAYADFVAGPRVEDVNVLYARRENLMVLRTFSKVHGLAGLRVGYAIAPVRVVDMFNRVREPFSVNALAQAAALAALEDEEHVRASVELVHSQRDELVARLRELGLETHMSQGNFLIVRSELPGLALYNGLRRRGFVTRHLAQYGLRDHLRFTIGRPGDMRRLLAAIGSILRRHPSYPRRREKRDTNVHPLKSATSSSSDDSDAPRSALRAKLA